MDAGILDVIAVEAMVDQLNRDGGKYEKWLSHYDNPVKRQAVDFDSLGDPGVHRTLVDPEQQLLRFLR